MEAATQASASTLMQVAPETGEEALAPSSVPDVSVGVAPARRAPPAQVLAITGARGGLGVSALLLHLAWALSRAGRRVAMMDLDPTGGLDLLCGQAVLTGLRWADLPVEESAFRPGHLVGALPVWHAIPVLTGDVRAGRRAARTRFWRRCAPSTTSSWWTCPAERPRRRRPGSCS